MKNNITGFRSGGSGHRGFFGFIAFIAFILLAFSCDSPFRTKVMTLTEAYTSIHDENAVYVDVASGSDSNPGTRELPKKTIQAGIDFVVAFLGTGTVKVKNGTYLQTEKLVIKEGASIEGGYDGNWVQRENQLTVVQGRDAQSGADNIVTAETLPGVTSATIVSYLSLQTGLGFNTMTVAIKNASPTFKYCTISGSGGIYETAAVAVMSLSGFTQRSEPVFYGCVIEGGDVGDIGTVPSGDTYGISTAGDASVTLKYCGISPGRSSSGKSYGVNFNASEFTIVNCIVAGVFASAAKSNAIGIYGKNGTLNLENSNITGAASGLNSIAVYSDNCGGYIRNNTVYGGKGSSLSVGVYLAGSRLPYVRNCTVNGGGSLDEAYGIFAANEGALVENCLLWTDNLATTSWSVALVSSGAEIFPAALNNSVFFSAMYSYGYAYEGPSGLSFGMSSSGVASMQNYLNSAQERSSANQCFSSVSGVGLKSAASDLDGSNWMLTGASPVSVTSGGLNLSALFTYDKTGRQRPISGMWSIGAFQYP